MQGPLYDAIQAETIFIPGGGGHLIEAYLATPLGPGPFGSVIVVHHAPGYDEATKEITRRLATAGFIALCPNLYTREAPPGLGAKEAAKQVRAAGGVTDGQVVDDLAGSARFLQARAAANGSVGVIGYCTGGRQAVLAACQMQMQAAVDCYGAYVTRSTPADDPLPRASIEPLLSGLSCPLLGLFGAEDSTPSVDEVAELEAALEKLGKEYAFHVYENAGHAFFSVDSPKYRTAAALDGWEKVCDWFERYLGNPADASA